MSDQFGNPQQPYGWQQQPQQPYGDPQQPFGQQPSGNQQQFGSPQPYGNQPYGYPQPYGTPAQPGVVPGTLKAAVVFMFIGGALEAIGAIGSLTGGAGATGFGAVISAGLWFWMAISCRQGKNWARITSTVFFAIDCVLLLVVIAAASKLAGTAGVGLVVGSAVLQWLIGLVAIVLLWMRPSSAYFSAMSGPRF